jgi:hypothetical protein
VAGSAVDQRQPGPRADSTYRGGQRSTDTDSLGACQCRVTLSIPHYADSEAFQRATRTHARIEEPWRIGGTPRSLRRRGESCGVAPWDCVTGVKRSSLSALPILGRQQPSLISSRWRTAVHAPIPRSLSSSATHWRICCCYVLDAMTSLTGTPKTTPPAFCTTSRRLTRDVSRQRATDVRVCSS